MQENLSKRGKTCNQESMQLVSNTGRCVNQVAIGFSFVSDLSKETLVFSDCSQRYFLTICRISQKKESERNYFGSQLKTSQTVTIILSFPLTRFSLGVLVEGGTKRGQKFESEIINFKLIYKLLLKSQNILEYASRFLQLPRLSLIFIAHSKMLENLIQVLHIVVNYIIVQWILFVFTREWNMYQIADLSRKSKL